MARIALFASGTASNARRILEHFGYAGSDAVARSPESPALQKVCQIACTISDRSTSGIHALAEASGIPRFRVSYDRGREQAEKEIQAILTDQKIDLVVLAGYMRILGTTIVNTYANRIVNIHPSLLPSFPGMHAIERSFESGIARVGVTIHLVDAGVDTGPVLVQASFDRTAIVSFEAFEEQIHRLEHILYPEVVEQVAKYIDNDDWPVANLHVPSLRESLPACFRLEGTHT